MSQRHGHASRLDQAALVAQHARQFREQYRRGRQVGAVVLHDAMGMAQEINAERLLSLEDAQTYAQSHARALSVSQSIMGLKKIVEQGALQSLTEMELAKGLPDIQTQTVNLGDPGFGPRMSHSFTTTREERAARRSKSTWADLAKHYDEARRSAFQAQYDMVMQSFLVETAQRDEDWARLVDSQPWRNWRGDYDPQRLRDCARFTLDQALCLSGGVMESASHDLWKCWLEAAPDDEAVPVFAALMLNQKPLLKHLLPEGGDSNKAAALYGAVKNIAESEEFKRHVTPQVKEAVAALQLALTSALGKIQSNVGAAGAQALMNMQLTVLRSQQAALLLYENVQTVMLRVQLTVGEYQRLLSEAAFGKLDQLGKASRTIAAGAGRQVRSVMLGGLLSIQDAAVRNTVVEVILWSFDTASDLRQQLDAALGDVRSGAQRLSGDLADAAADISRAGAVAAGRLGAETRRVRLGMSLLGQQSIAQLGRLQSGAHLSATQAALFTRNLMGKSLRVAGSGHVILAAGAVFFQGWTLRDSYRAVNSALGPKSVEAQLALVSPGVGLAGTVVEVAGHGLTALGKEIGKKLVTRGGLLAAGAGVVDAIQSGFAGARTWKAGDMDAAGYYFLAGAAFLGSFVAATVAVVSSLTLLGPLGVALGLIAAGVLLTWKAINAEDTQTQIWLDRCYFGRGLRSEGQWTDAEAGQEMAALNAILVGLNARMGFSDAWLGVAERITGYERIDVEIRIADFDTNKGAYEWRLKVRHNEGAKDIPVIAGRYRVAAPQQFMSASPRRSPFWRRDDSDRWFKFAPARQRYEDGALVITQSVELMRRYFKRAQLEVSYWPDHADQDALAHIILVDTD